MTLPVLSLLPVAYAPPIVRPADDGGSVNPAEPEAKECIGCGQRARWIGVVLGLGLVLALGVITWKRHQARAGAVAVEDEAKGIEEATGETAALEAVVEAEVAAALEAVGA